MKKNVLVTIDTRSFSIVPVKIFYKINLQIRALGQRYTLFFQNRLLKYNNFCHYTITDCYQAIERDYNLDQRVVRDTIRVTGLVKCQEACTDSRLFPCRIFAFSTSLSNNYNCYLSDRRGKFIFKANVYLQRICSEKKKRKYIYTKSVTNGFCFRYSLSSSYTKTPSLVAICLMGISSKKCSDIETF